MCWSLAPPEINPNSEIETGNLPQSLALSSQVENGAATMKTTHQKVERPGSDPRPGKISFARRGSVLCFKSANEDRQFRPGSMGTTVPRRVWQALCSKGTTTTGPLSTTTSRRTVSASGIPGTNHAAAANDLDLPRPKPGGRRVKLVLTGHE